MGTAMSHVHRGFGAVRPYLHGPADLPGFLQQTFGAVELERNEEGPTLLQIGDSLLWVEAGDLPPHVAPWVGSVYVYVADVDAAYGRAMSLGAKSISAPEDKPYNERQAGFVDAGATPGGCRPIREGHPRSAFGAPPGEERDRPRSGAACKARQRPGKAGSAAAAWLRRFMRVVARSAIESNGRSAQRD